MVNRISDMTMVNSRSDMTKVNSISDMTMVNSRSNMTMANSRSDMTMVNSRSDMTMVNNLTKSDSRLCNMCCPLQTDYNCCMYSSVQNIYHILDGKKVMGR